MRGYGATSPPLEEVGPPHVFEAASDGEQGVGARFRPAASRLFESVADDVLAGAFHDAGTDRQSARPIEIATHSVRVGLAVADEGRDGFGPVAVPERRSLEDHVSKVLQKAFTEDWSWQVLWFRYQPSPEQERTTP